MPSYAPPSLIKWRTKHSSTPPTYTKDTAGKPLLHPFPPSLKLWRTKHSSTPQLLPTFSKAMADKALLNSSTPSLLNSFTPSLLDSSTPQL